eukprot:Phypoly_transcript_00470.p1 GENE.Phypoly_transcript_00470~~Phypoly_transcript_00470.p1  ORF type:complete len:781 (-),score=102.87 Phypoly_transcript_00470:244-2586(-)
MTLQKTTKLKISAFLREIGVLRRSAFDCCVCCVRGTQLKCGNGPETKTKIKFKHAKGHQIINEALLVQQLKTIFPNENINVNTRKQSELKYASHSSHQLELDVWLPEQNICFEFQDPYHYVTSWYYQQSVKQQQYQDNEKWNVVRNTGLRLVVIPCWWDGSLKRLMATIHFYCPELFPPVKSREIQLNPPRKFFNERVIPEVGELMYVSVPTNWQVILDNKWWLGEKYDGIRLCWNPSKNVVYSRFAKEYLLPSHVKSAIPRIVIDGEFWSGRELYSLMHPLANKLPDRVLWELLRITAFDSPNLQNQFLPFESRYRLLVGEVPTDSALVILSPRILLRDHSLIQYFSKIILENGGEGIILRKCASLYEHGRSPSLIKLKATIGDSEGIVLGITTELVHLQQANGATVSVPQENNFLGEDVKVGDVVTFSYENVNQKDIPLDPKIIRVRHDVAWKEVAKRQEGIPSEPVQDKVPKKSSWGSVKKRRSFFENYAKRQKFDPLDPQKWYTQSKQHIASAKGGYRVIAYYSGSVSKALLDLFPEIGFDKTKLEGSPWLTRETFERYAKRNKFDPLTPENWYRISGNPLVLEKDGHEVQMENFTKALPPLFPEIVFETSKLQSPKWSKKTARRKSFEDFAKTNNFDPLVPENWYSQPKQKLLGIPGIEQIIGYHSDSISNALQDLFPELGLDRSKFRMSPWHTQKNRRQAFEEYARQHGFDPLHPENWYLQKKHKILSTKAIYSVLEQYNYNLPKALLDLFPEIGLESSNFSARLGKSQIRSKI